MSQLSGFGFVSRQWGKGIAAHPCKGGEQVWSAGILPARSFQKARRMRALHIIPTATQCDTENPGNEQASVAAETVWLPEESGNSFWITYSRYETLPLQNHSTIQNSSKEIVLFIHSPSGLPSPKGSSPARSQAKPILSIPGILFILFVLYFLKNQEGLHVTAKSVSKAKHGSG